MELLYYEDIQLNEKEILGDYLVDRDEAVEFAKKWDPQLFHIDEEAAKSFPTNGLIVSAVYTLAVITRLGVTRGTQMANLGGLGLENVRFPIPIRPGDRITISGQCIEKRESRSRP
ncbi:MAG: acyl dehydratase, partial [Deltaproteobacteria bacterium]|nr:acyl dehydratase [Deltaproteobacteria bacterium]